MRTCRQCGKQVSVMDMHTFCVCGGVYDDFAVNIFGTRDSFGITKSFYDPKTNKDIDTWKKWEKAGFRKIDDVKDKRNPEVNEKAKWHKKRKTKNTKTPYLDVAERM